MKELIKITQHNGNSFISARELHKFLEVGKVFGAWINERIEQFGFIENQDYVVFSEIGKNPKGGRPMKEYLLSIDMAKELSMLERNGKGEMIKPINTQKAKGNNSINSNINNIEGNVTISHNDFSNLLELQKGYQDVQKELNERLKTSQKQIDTLLEILKNK